MIRFLLTLLVFYALWQIVKFLFRIWLANWVRKNAGKGFQFQGQFGGKDFQREEERPVGDIRIDNPGKRSQSSTVA